MSNHEPILQKFSSFIYLRINSTTNRIVPIYYSHPILQELIADVFSGSENDSEAHWTNSFLQTLRSFEENTYPLKQEKGVPYWTYSILGSSYCQHFLFCYLQNPSWRAAKKVHYQLSQSFNIDLQYPLEECFVLALEQALYPKKLLKSFDINAGGSAQSYAYTALCRLVKHQIAKELKSKSLKLSGYGFLKSVTATQLEKGLRRWGISGDELIRYRLVWQSFKDVLDEISVKNGQKGCSSIQSLNQEQLTRLKSIYQDYAKAFKLKAKSLNRQEIEEVLDTCLKATQEGDRKKAISLDALQVAPSVNEESSPLVENPWQVAFQQEEKEQLNAYRELILEALNGIDPIGSLSLLLWLGLDINQKDFLASFGVQKQYQVARQFQRYQKDILTLIAQAYLAKQSNPKKTKSFKSEFCSKEKLAYLKSYLEFYSKSFFTQILEEVIFYHLSSEERQQILEEIEQPVSETNELEKIRELFVVEIEKRLGIKLTSYESYFQKIENFLKDWLARNKATLSAKL
ncbi:hypothetical protein PCC7418_3458 [Halothece sp. PCC 7418]|uniref:hypothetical protein n=1 Tax=Halothece sp. (strain PCC 7418) TaxID=65093 RepID=UPI0002A07B73|nr:hypothetical protein [Halothece sp. PCC 7418]AFZ45570.1 hypothetical protein PCC7418_3458 [Halothece sp. PCC 7418]